jgi:hypothetical protein
MNRAIPHYDEEPESENQIEFRRAAPRPNDRTRRANYLRRQRPTGYSGIHRRRNKRWTW